MRIRLLILLAALALIVAACSPSDSTDEPDTSTDTAAVEQSDSDSSSDDQSDTDEGESGSDDDNDSDESSSGEPIEAPDAMQLSYDLEAGTTYTYEVGLDQNIELTAEGDSAAAGSEDEIPGSVSINLSGTSTFTHEISEGTEEGTFEIRITGDFSDLTVTGTVDGEDVGSEIPDFAELDAEDVTIIVDEMGNVISADGTLEDDALGGADLSGLGGFGDFGSAAGDPGQFIGPALSEEEVTVGDTWSETIEIPGVLEGEAIVTQIDSEVVAAERVDGHDVLVIETTTATDAISFDLGEILIGFMLAFVPEDISAEEQAELDAMAESIKFLFEIDETVTSNTTWFDFEAGIARQAEHESDVNIVMDINAPDDETGELQQFRMDMSIDQVITYRLVDSDSA